MEQFTTVPLESAAKARQLRPPCLLAVVLGPCWFPDPSVALAGALAGTGQTGFSSSAGNSALRKAAGLPCVTCHLYCCQEQAFNWPFPEDDEELGLSFGTSSVHGSPPGILGSCISFAVGRRLLSTAGV